MMQFLSDRLRPFRHQSFRRFFYVQAISLVGTWAHDLARAWIVISLIGKASALGSLLLATALPGLLLTLQGGVLADRLDVKKIMIVTKSVLAISALAVAGVVEFADVKMWHLLVFGVIEGCVVAFDQPTFQALAVRLVPREDFQQAIALNSMNFHAGRMLGPVIAGGLMALYGPSLVFLFDAISYLGLIFVLRTLDLKVAQRKANNGFNQGQLLVEGLRYVFNEPRLRFMTLQLLMTISLLIPVLMVIFRTYLAAKFKLQGDEFGYLFMFPAVGSMLGAFSFALFQPKNPIKALRFGVPLTGAGLIAVNFATTPFLAGLLMALAGFALYLTFSSLTVSMHLTVEDEFRGRMGSLIGLGFGAFGPLMSFPLGLYADFVGADRAILTITLLFLAFSGLLAFLSGKSLSNQQQRPAA